MLGENWVFVILNPPPISLGHKLKWKEEHYWTRILFTAFLKCEPIRLVQTHLQNLPPPQTSIMLSTNIVLPNDLFIQFVSNFEYKKINSLQFVSIFLSESCAQNNLSVELLQNFLGSKFVLNIEHLNMDKIVKHPFSKIFVMQL